MVGSNSGCYVLPPSSYVLRAAALTLLYLLGASAASLAQDPPPPSNPTVVSLSFVSDGIVDETEVANLVTIRVGEPLTPEATGSTIRNLFETGVFANIGVEAQTVEGGVAVVLRLSRAYRVFPLKFSGVPLPREELRRIVGFAEGEPYSKEQVDDGAGILKRRLAGEEPRWNEAQRPA